MTPRLTFATRIGLIAVAAVAVVWMGAVALFYVSQSRGPNGALPLPAQVAAIAVLLERTPVDRQQDVLDAVSSDALRARLESGDRVGSASTRPLLRLGERALDAALAGRRTSVTLAEGRWRWLSRLAPDTLELRVALATGQTLILDTRATRLATFFGLPVGFGAGLFGTLIALIALVVILRETRPLARLAAHVDGIDLARADGPTSTTAIPGLTRGAPEIRALVAAFDRLQTRLAQLMKARMAMLGGISHDVRTFATRLRLRVDAIPDGDQRRRAVGDIDDMIRLLDDALLASRASVGELTDELVDVDEVVRGEVGDRVLHGASIAMHAASRDAAVSVLGDRLALRRIAANLLDNATRHGQRVEVRVERVADVVAWTVDDDGPGIPADRRELLLEPFTRLDASRNRETGGAGLGLAIVRTLVEAHGGRVRIDDSPLGGARIDVRLPAFVVDGEVPVR